MLLYYTNKYHNRKEIKMNVVEVLIEGGKATPGPPLGPALGPLGANIKEIVNSVNERTKDYEGMVVPVKITLDGDRVDITVGVPSTAALIKKDAVEGRW
jgi:large subunit ribosomal protein L11